MASVPDNQPDNPALRNKLVELRMRSEQWIDTVSKDKTTFFGSTKEQEDHARKVIMSFKQFIEQHKDELAALQIIYGKPYGQRHLTYDTIRELADAIKQPPVNLTREVVWQAYEKLERARVRGAGPQTLLTNVVSLVRFALGKVDFLEPFDATVNRRFAVWLIQQQRAGRRFTVEQLEWLTMIKDHIATSLEVSVDDLDLAPFRDRGGAVKAHKTFGKDLDKVLREMNEVLAA